MTKIYVFDGLNRVEAEAAAAATSCLAGPPDIDIGETIASAGPDAAAALPSKSRRSR